MRKWIPALVAVFVIGALGAGTGEAEKAAEASAGTWLATVDSGDYGKSWDDAAALFRKTLTRSQWVAALGQARAPLGKLESRKLKSATYSKDLPGAPAGEYVVIVYDSDFAARSGMTETVTPMKDPDGVWRVSGYYIK